MDQTVRKSVSVLMPVYNAEKYLKEAIESILNQTFTDFELLIINDGSTDSSESIILSYKSPRIKYYKNEVNSGLIYTLNKGIGLIDSEYIARMDSDDIALPGRLLAQKKYMDANPGTWLCGTQVEYFGNIQKTSGFPLSHEEIKANLLLGNCIAHPSVMMRTQKLKANGLLYSADFVHIEDYELWIRLSRIGKIANLNNVLLRYRMENQNITVNNWETRKARFEKVFRMQMAELEIPLTKENIELHFELSGNSENVSDTKKLIDYSRLIIKKNKLKKIYGYSALKNRIHLYWKQLFFKVLKNGTAETFRYWLYTGKITKPQASFVMGRFKAKMFPGK